MLANCLSCSPSPSSSKKPGLLGVAIAGRSVGISASAADGLLCSSGCSIPKRTARNVSRGASAAVSTVTSAITTSSSRSLLRLAGQARAP